MTLPAKYLKIEQRYEELEQLLADSSIIADQSQYQKLAKEYSGCVPLVTLIRAYKENMANVDDIQKLLKEKHDPEFEEFARGELDALMDKQEILLAQLNDLTNPKKQQKDRDLLIEIRAGTGGLEASLFAADLFRMYTKYADQMHWKIEMISSNESETGGFKEVIFSVSGAGAEKHLQYESGAHRVQRVPETEASGRIHTSAATVAVLFEPEEVDVKIDAKDLKIDVFRSSGPGGQSVNTTDSAIRITHLPTGMVVVCQDERSQLKNKHKAMRVLRARLMDKIRQENEEKTTKDRRLKIGTGDRSEKIRTYNYPDRRVTDHRIGFTTHRLTEVLDGNLKELTEALIKADEEDQMNDRK